MTFVWFLVMASSVALAQGAAGVAPNSAESEKAAIRTLLAKQVDAWNRGDLEGFMAGYWKSPELSFFSGDQVTQGWAAMLERYRKKYQGAGKEATPAGAKPAPSGGPGSMGQLDFFDLRVGMLGPESAFVRGHWHLRMKTATAGAKSEPAGSPGENGLDRGGLFTLILRKFPEGWRIVHDHTS